jgi:hypothetical protein
VTATVVDGKKVEAAEPTKSGLWTPERPVFFLNCMELLLEDGSTTYGCRFCDYTDDKVGRIRMHQTKFCKFNPNPPSKDKKVALVEAKKARARKPQPVKPEPEPAAEEDEDFGDILAALELALKTPGPDSQLAELTKRVSELEQENRQLTTERNWWKTEHKVVSDAMNGVSELLRKHGFK